MNKKAVIGTFSVASFFSAFEACLFAGGGVAVVVVADFV